MKCIIVTDLHAVKTIQAYHSSIHYLYALIPIRDHQLTWHTCFWTVYIEYGS